MEESRLIDLCVAGNRDAYDGLIRLYEKDLYKYCYRLSGNEHMASDLYQDTWVKVMKNIGKYDPSLSFRNWLLSIATNAFRDSYRKKKRWDQRMLKYTSQEMKDKAFAALKDTSPLPLEEVEAAEQQAMVQKALLALNEKSRMVLTLFYFQQLSLEEMAVVLKVPVGTVKSRLHQAKKKMQQQLEVVMWVN